MRLAVLYGLHLSELLGLQWSTVNLKVGTLRIEQALVEVDGRPEWTEGKNARSRGTIPIDPDMAGRIKGRQLRQRDGGVVQTGSTSGS